jgi:hypothetical protein
MVKQQRRRLPVNVKPVLTPKVIHRPTNPTKNKNDPSSPRLLFFVFVKRKTNEKC